MRTLRPIIADRPRIWVLPIGLAASLAVLGASACGGAEATGSDALSYDEHLEAAQRHEQRVASIEERAQLEAVEVEGHQVPHQGDRERAERSRAHADEHRQAAAALEASELAACEPAPTAARQTCPFQSGYEVLDADEIPGGARVVLDTPDADLVRASVACHQAHAAYRGYEGMSECPFYLPDVDVTVAPTPTGTTEIRLVSEDEATAEAIRDRSVRAWEPGAASSDVELLWRISTGVR